MLYLRNLTRPAFVVLAFLALGLIAAACGGDSEEEGTPAATTEPSPAATATTSPTGGSEGVTLDVVFGDSFFEPATMTVEAGQTVAIRVENRGSALHNMRIAGADDVYDEGDDDIVSNPDAMRGGDTGELTVTFDQPGTYRFRCDFHPVIMTGEIVVE